MRADAKQPRAPPTNRSRRYRRSGPIASIRRRAAMSRTNAEAQSNFPHWVALGSLAFVLWLFFSNLVPALRDRDQLEALRSDLVGMRRNYDAAIQEARLGLGPNAHYDLQALLVAIDQQGYTPFELCVAYPLQEPERQPAEDPNGNAPTPPVRDESTEAR
jgi:hypothetical protein